MFRVVIPARHASTRLPGKPLLPLAGLPMVLHVHRLALGAGAQEVVIATDDERIRSICAEAGADVEMTSAGHESGTDRAAEVATRRGWPDDSIVVNVQGDEPMLPPVLIAQVANLLSDSPLAAIATLATPITSPDAHRDPNVVKVVARDDGHALYFSRAPIPWMSEGAGTGQGRGRSCREARRHVGLYAYRAGALRRLAALPASALERLERLEQLRALQAGLVIQVADATEAPGPHVDTREDYDRVAGLMGGGAPP